MSELIQLQRFIAEGCRPAMELLDANDQRWLELYVPGASADSSATKAIPLTHSERGKFLMFLREPEAIALAQKLADEQHEIIAYNPLVYLSAIGPETILGNIVYLDSIVDNLRETLGWDAIKSKYANTIEIRAMMIGDNRGVLQAFYDSVDQVALLLSSKNKIGFVAGGRCPGEMYRGQPFSIHFGRQECNPQQITEDEVLRAKSVWADDQARGAAESLQTIYSQVTDRARLMAAWAALEEHFGCQKPKHLLNDDELDAVLAAVDGVESISNQKKEALSKFMRNSTNISEKTRNERIAGEIAELTGESYESVLKRVRHLAGDRGGQVHKLSGTAKPIRVHLDFVHSVLSALIIHRVRITISKPSQDKQE